jgi:uncharacterized protein (TIGR02001 family)
MTLVAAIAAASGAHATEPIIDAKNFSGGFSADVALTNDYVFRGISQSDAKRALQGSISYGYDFGSAAESLNTWCSKVEFNNGDQASVEIDYTLDVSTSVLGDKLGLSGVAIYYSYPGAADSLNYDNFEIYAAAPFDVSILLTTVGLNFAPHYFENSEDFLYPYVDFSTPLGKYLDFGVHAGYNDFTDTTEFAQRSYWAVVFFVSLSKI